MLKKLLLFLGVVLPFAASAQLDGSFTLSGKLAKVNQPIKAYLVYKLGANNVIDSATLVDGGFQFSGTVMFPVNAIMAVDHRGVGFSGLTGSDDILSFYIEKGNLYLSGTDSLKSAKITGSAINAENEQLQAGLTAVNQRAQRLYTEAQKATTLQQKSAEFQNSMNAKLKGLQNEQENILKNFISTHTNSYLSLMALSSLGGPSADAAKLEPLYAKLSKELKATEAGIQLRQSLDALKAVDVGSVAPDFTQNDVNGAPVKLSSFRGKYVLLDFWASWCGPCRQENPNVVKAYQKFKDRKFTILGVSLDRPSAKDAWLQAIKQDGLEWTQVSDLKFWDNAAAKLYNVRSIPQNYLIDPQGKIIAKNLRGDDLDNKLSEIFRQLDKGKTKAE